MSKPGKSKLVVETANSESVEGDKRQYMPFVLTCACDNCGSEIRADMCEDPHYLSYPSIGNADNPAEPCRYTMYCEECEHVQSYQFRLVVSLEVVS